MHIRRAGLNEREAPGKVATARPPKRLAQLRTFSHVLVSTLQKHRSIKVKIDTIWQPTFQRQLGVFWYGGSYVVNLFKTRCITKKNNHFCHTLLPSSLHKSLR